MPGEKISAFFPLLYVFFGYALNVRCTFPGVARVTKEPGKHERAVWLVIFLHDSLSLFVFLEIVGGRAFALHAHLA